MRKSTLSVLCASILLACASSASMAQSKGGGPPPRVTPPTITTKGDRLHTQDRLKTQDKLHDQDRLKDQDKLHDQDRTQDRDRLHDQDGQTIYAAELMTPAERNAYMAHMRSLKTLQERNAYREQHRTEMQQRARERGVTIPPDNGQGTQQQGNGNGG